MNPLDFQRYVVHDFLCGKPIFVDRLEKTLTFYDNNLYGQIYNLKSPERHAISAAKINGLIRRTNGSNYNFTNSFAVDGYIYTYLMSPEQQGMCRRKPDIPGWNELIVQTDDYAGAVKTMCEWVYENKYPASLGDKEARRGELLQYCERFLSGRQDAPPTREPATQQRGHDDRYMKRPLAYITAAWSGNKYKDTDTAARYCRAVYEAGFSPVCPELYMSMYTNDAIPEEHKSRTDMSRDLLRRSRVLVVCGNGINEDVKNDIAIAARLKITATTLDGILTVQGQGRGKKA